MAFKHDTHFLALGEHCTICPWNSHKLTWWGHKTHRRERRLWKTFPLYAGCNMPRASFCHNKLDLWITFNFAKFQFISVRQHTPHFCILQRFLFMILAVHCYVFCITFTCYTFLTQVFSKTPICGHHGQTTVFCALYCHNPLSMFTGTTFYFCQVMVLYIVAWLLCIVPVSERMLHTPFVCEINRTLSTAQDGNWQGSQKWRHIDFCFLKILFNSFF